MDGDLLLRGDGEDERKGREGEEGEEEKEEGRMNR